MAQTQFVVAGSGAGTDFVTAQYMTGAAAALPTQTFFTAPFPCSVSVVETLWDTVAGAASTVQITKDTGTTAMGAGSTILAGAIDMTGTARTAVAPALTAVAADLLMVQGDRLSAKVASGAATGSSGVNFTVKLVRT